MKRKQINYNRSDGDEDPKQGIIGNRTIQAISNAITYETWKGLPAEGKFSQAQLVEDLITFSNKKALYQRLSHPDKWGFSKGFGGQAYQLAANEEIEDGYAKHCKKVLITLPKYLRAGYNYYDSCKKAGYHDSSDNIDKKPKLLAVKDIDNIANPIVQKALFEVRRVLNSVIKRYGHPAVIRVELARDMKASKKHRAEIEKQQGENRKHNAEAEQELWNYYKDGSPNLTLEKHHGNQRISPNDRRKYKIWHYEQDNKCVYCTRHIGINELLSERTEEDHIFPQSAFSQNYMNTVVACRNMQPNKRQSDPL